MVRKRIFIAIDVSEDAKRFVAEHISLLRREFPDLRVNWERAEKLHLTLKFLGETEIVLLEQLKRRISLDAASVESFCFTITGSGVFPGVRNPRVLWLGIQEHSGNLRKLQRSIDKSCVALGFKPEQREFKPHLTIGRIRDSQMAHKLVNFHLETKFEDRMVEVREVIIYESLLSPQGSAYEVLSKHPLR